LRKRYRSASRARSAISAVAISPALDPTCASR
jgi:hypothetical protein